MRWLVFCLCLLATPATAATLTVTLTASEPVIVTGSPRIAIDVGGVTRYATYSGSTGAPLTSLPFSYAVQAGDLDANGIDVTPSIDLNGATLTDRAGKPTRRLAGFQRVELQPGEDKAVQIRIEPRILADWAGDGWAITPGAYRFAIGTDAETLEESAALTLPARRLKP